MSDLNSAEVGGEQTPAPADPVESTSTASIATESTPQTEVVVAADKQPDGDPWDRAIAEASKDEPAAETQPEQKTEPSTTDTPTIDEKPAEEQILADAFADTPDDDAEPDKGDDTPKSQEEIDEEIDKLNPDEMRKTLKPYRAAYLARTEKFANPLKQLKYDEITPADTFAQLEPVLGGEKLFALKQQAAHELVDANPAATFQRAYAIRMRQINPSWDPASEPIPTLDDMISGQKTAPESAPAAAFVPPAEANELTQLLGWDWRDESLDDNFMDDRERTMARTLRALEAAAASAPAVDSPELKELREKAEKAEELQKQLDALNEVQMTEAEKAVHTEYNVKSNDLRSSVQAACRPFILKQLKLEVSKDDPPDFAAFKEDLQELIDGDEYEKANNLESKFERFVYNEAAVAKDLEKVVGRALTSLAKAVVAEKAGDTAAAEQHMADVDAEKPTIYNLIAAATKEFNSKVIMPKFQRQGKVSEQIAAPLATASQRVEVVGNGGQPQASSKKPEYASADDVWAGAIAEAAREDALRAGA